MQVVRNPVLDGPCFFVRGDRLIWLDEECKPTGKEQTIALDVKPNPKRITLTPVGRNKDDKPSNGIYSATGSSLIIHLGLHGGPAPKQFLELNKPIKGVDDSEWLVSRKKLKGEWDRAEPADEFHRTGERVPLLTDTVSRHDTETHACA